MTPQFLDIEQGSQDWLELRKTKITATDAAVILGENPWKTAETLFLEKTGQLECVKKSKAMQRGLDLEPIARKLFKVQTRLEMHPQVIVKGFLMASLDGMTEDKKTAVEIKCPGPKDHFFAEDKTVPPYYFAQLQHQMFVADLPKIYYYSFDGLDGIYFEVPRDDAYIENMLEKERAFYEKMLEFDTVCH